MTSNQILAALDGKRKRDNPACKGNHETGCVYLIRTPTKKMGDEWIYYYVCAACGYKRKYVEYED